MERDRYSSQAVSPMKPYRFLKSGKIFLEDLEKIIELTEKGILVWRDGGGGSLKATPVGVDLHNQDACERVVGENLRGIEIAWNKDGNVWYYLSLKDDEKKNAVMRREETSSEERNSIDRLFEMAQSLSKINPSTT